MQSVIPFVEAANGAVLYSCRALPTGNSLGTELWDTSAYNNTAPANPGSVRFVVPTIADGKIFIARGGQRYQPNSSNCPYTERGCGAHITWSFNHV